MPESNTSVNQVQAANQSISGRTALLITAAGGLCFGIAGIVTACGLPLLAGFALLGAALGCRGRARPFWLVLLWGAIGYATGLSWCLVFGGVPWLLLTAWHVLFLLPAAMLTGLTMRQRRIAPASLALAGLFALGEWLRGRGDLGVSMHTAAGALARSLPAVQWAGVFGPEGLSCAAAAIGLLLGFSWKARRPVAAAAAVAAIAVLHAGGLVLLRSGPAPAGHIAIAAVQGVSADGFKQTLSASKAEDAYIALTTDAAKQHGARAVVWPETSCPGDPVTDDSLQLRLATAFKRLGVSALVGCQVRQPGSEGLPVLRNLVLGFGPDGFLTGAYEKMRLVPFGEYVPRREAWPPVLGRWGVPEEDYAPGREWPPVPLGDAKAGVLVCSESMFPELAAKRVRQGANLLAVASNDSYFKRTPGAGQIARQSILRAVETRRSVARAAETGYSMMIDPRGRVLSESRLYERTVVSARLPLTNAETVYSQTTGWWPPIIAALTALASAAASWRRRGGSSAPSDRPS